MPFTTNGKRDYKRELEWEHKKKPNRVKDRAERNQSRKEMGLAVGDPRVADHKIPLDSKNPKSKDKSNIQILSFKANSDKETKRKRSKKGNN